jgi:hypothetical protein
MMPPRFQDSKLAMERVYVDKAHYSMSYSTHLSVNNGTEQLIHCGRTLAHAKGSLLRHKTKKRSQVRKKD